jgi:hypothetical protein
LKKQKILKFLTFFNFTTQKFPQTSKHNFYNFTALIMKILRYLYRMLFGQWHTASFANNAHKICSLLIEISDKCVVKSFYCKLIRCECEKLSQRIINGEVNMVEISKKREGLIKIVLVPLKQLIKMRIFSAKKLYKLSIYI